MVIQWIVNGTPDSVFQVKKVPAEKSVLDPLTLIASKERIGHLIMGEKNYTKAKKLEAIYKTMDEAINKSL